MKHTPQHRKQLTALLVEAHKELQRTRATYQLNRTGILMQRQAQTSSAAIYIASRAVIDAMEAVATGHLPTQFVEHCTDTALQTQRQAIEITDHLMTNETSK